MARLAAVIVLLIPGFAAAYGIKMMRDSLFGIQVAMMPNMTLQFIVGFTLMVLGVGFFGGFLLRRDQRKGRVQERFQLRDSSAEPAQRVDEQPKQQ